MSDQTQSVTEVGRVDRRVEKTRSALRSAFNHLILTKGYDGFTAADIAERANVGRSTFYEHHQSKDDILAQSLETVLEPLAEACVGEGCNPRVGFTTEHFWENRKLATALLSGRARGVVAKALARLIETRLEAKFRDRLTLPRSLIAAQLAHTQLGLIEEWLTGRHRCSASDIADALNISAAAVVQALAKPK